jgi:DNA gyrase subunit A
MKQLLQEFLRHRVDVLRRRTEFLLAEARKRKHTVEGLLIAQLNIDQVIDTIRRSPSRAEARERLQALLVPGELIARALGEAGYRSFQDERGVAESYPLTATQSEAIVAMQLGSLAGLEREKLGDEFRKLLEDITEFLRLLSDEAHLLGLVRGEMEELKQKYGDKRRTEISDEELEEVNREDLITEETMAVTLSHRGYIKRMELDTYKAQKRGGRGIAGAKTDEEDPIEHLFVASTHDYLLFFTDRGKVFWQKVYDIPLLNRTAKGRALVNLLNLQEGEKVFNCLAVREFDEVRQVVMATRNGTVKKTALSEYSRPKSGGIIAIRLEEGDALIDVVLVSPGDDLLVATNNGMAIRFSQEDARSMGRATFGVKGIDLAEGDFVVGMVVAHPEMDLLTVCENGYGKRTPFGPPEIVGDDDNGDAPDAAPEPAPEAGEGVPVDLVGETLKSGTTYRRQRRGGKGLRNIRTTDRNGKVVDVIGVNAADEVLMITAGGIIQRVRAGDISRIGRNTQGVRIIRLDEGDKLVSLARVPPEEME